MMKKVLFGVAIGLIIIIGSGCLSATEEPELMLIEATPIPTPSAAAPIIDYLNVSDETCGECHIKAFTSISQEGGGHDKGCIFCHIQHGVKLKCTDCHELIHGIQLQDCKDCHDEHAPMGITISLDLESSCSLCHPKQIEEFSDHPSRHGDMKCGYCHQTHGQIEACTNCHAPHSKGLIYNDCLNCHPAHMPLDINYSRISVPLEQCAICHEGAGTALEQSNTEHTSLECAYCHPVHKQIPECMDCHTPHDSDMTISDCQGCHPAHDPAVINIPLDITRNDCAICHEAIDTELRLSNTKHDDLNCIYCHPKHGYLPPCESCHGLPHKKEIHDLYTECTKCHIVVHDVKNIVFTE
ncbi:MAG: hypothetical protein KAR85_03860 [Methanosarcinales archaeon]|nr:hypothetical protein [Methanosarcinales archaeon]